MPPNQAVSVKAQLKINARREQTPPRRDIAELIFKKSRALLAEDAPAACDAQLVVANAVHLQHIADATVDLVVTSPPFLDVVDYRGDNWLRNWFAGIDVESIRLSQLRAPEDWRAMNSRRLRGTGASREAGRSRRL